MLTAGFLPRLERHNRVRRAARPAPNATVAAAPSSSLAQVGADNPLGASPNRAARIPVIAPPVLGKIPICPELQTNTLVRNPGGAR